MKNLFTGWRIWIVLLGFALIAIGAIIGITAPVRHGNADLEALGNHSRTTGGVLVIIGVVICAGMFIYNYINSKNEKGTELDNRFK
jgi:uncharacterized membrane protein